MNRIEVLAVDGLPEIAAGDDVAGLIADHAELADDDVVVVTQKIVSKAENRVVAVDPADPDGHRAVVESEAVRVLRRRGDLVITETRHGFVCANAGVDQSNMPVGLVALLPVDPDRSARRLAAGLLAHTGHAVGVIVSDTFGRPWRQGVVDIAIGSAGLRPVIDLRGTSDAAGRELSVTEIGIVDEIAAAAELVMGKTRGCPVAIVRGIDPTWFGPGSVRANIIRDAALDLFR